MSFKVVKLTIGKGKTVSDEKAGEWIKRYYEAEVVIEDEHDIEIAKASVEGLIDGWLTGTSIVEPQAQPQLAKPKWNPEKIKWAQAKGARGDYERYPAEDQKVEATDDYKALLLDLKEHKLFFFRDGWNYWLFPDLVTVGRRRKEAKP
jgi:hypothetical protein